MSREDNYHLSSVTVITSLIANFIHGRSVTRRKHFALRKFWKIKVFMSGFCNITLKRRTITVEGKTARRRLNLF